MLHEWVSTLATDHQQQVQMYSFSRADSWLWLFCLKCSCRAHTMPIIPTFLDILSCLIYLRKVKVLVNQLCTTLCNPMDGSPPGSSAHGIFQARTLEWVAIPSPGDLPDPGIGLGSPALQVDSLPSEALIFVSNYEKNVFIFLMARLSTSNRI